MWGDHFLASLSIPHHIYTPVRTGLAFLFLHLPRNDTISRILRMRIRRHIFLHRRVCCKCSFCQHRSGFCNYSTDRLKSWIWVNSMFYIFSFIRKIKEKITLFITPILKSLMVPVIWLALTDVIYSRIAPFFALNQIFFSSQWGSNVKSKTTNQIQGSKCYTAYRKMKDKEWQIVANFATFVSKTLTFFPQKMGDLNFRPAQYCINKIFELTKSCIWAISKWM